MSSVNFYKQYMAKLQVRAEAAVKEAMQKAFAEYFEVAETKVKNIYRETIDDFYNSYNRTFYSPRGSLYELIESARGDNYLEMWFEPSRISYRNGYSGENGLYDKVFRQGWHGGANINGNMLIPWSVPPVAYDGENAPWSSYQNIHGWKQAEQAAISPLNDFKNRIAIYQKKEYQQDYARIWDKYKSQITINMS